MRSLTPLSPCATCVHHSAPLCSPDILFHGGLLPLCSCPNSSWDILLHSSPLRVYVVRTRDATSPLTCSGIGRYTSTVLLGTHPGPSNASVGSPIGATSGPTGDQPKRFEGLGGSQKQSRTTYSNSSPVSAFKSMSTAREFSLSLAEWFTQWCSTIPGFAFRYS